MPTEDKVTRKLRAILSADVKGYSLLMANDEAFTIKTLKEYRGIMSEQIQEQNGRVVDAPGDNLLAEFSSVVNAVECAVEIQNILKNKNGDLPLEKRLEYRIGVNIGDVVQDGDRIYGSGVNVAARIEGLAEPGGICISRNAFDHIKDKLNFGYEYLGDHEVKNIKEPVRVYKVLMAPEDAGVLIGEKAKTMTQLRGWVTAFIILAFLASAFWYVNQKPKTQTKPTTSTQDPIDLKLVKASIGVLPFSNLNNDPGQDYFSEGITDDIITALSKTKSIKVISRNSMFTYKKNTKTIPEIARDLKVRYILEGTTRREGDAIRINAKLIDAATDQNIWAEQFNGTYENVFEFQDAITGKIVAELAVKLTPEEERRVTEKGTENIKAYDEFLKGMKYYYHMTPEDLTTSVGHYKKSIELDPQFSRAYAALGITYQVGHLSGFAKEMDLNPIIMRLKARQYLEIAMQNPTSEAFRLAGYMEIQRRHFDIATEHFLKAISLSTSCIDAHIGLGWALIAADRPEEALNYLHEAIKIDPLQSLGSNLAYIGMAFFSMGNYEKAIDSIKKAQKQNPDLHQFSGFTAAAYAQLNKLKEAKIAFDNYLTPYPDGIYPTIRQLSYRWPFKGAKVFNRLCEGLIQTGLPGDQSEYYVLNLEKRLKNNEIKNLLIGNTMYGTFIGKLRWQRSIDKNGTSNFITTYDQHYNGRYWIKDEMVCWRWENLYENLKDCADIYHITNEDSHRTFTHVAATDYALVPFSIE